MARGYVSRFDLFPGQIQAHFVGTTGLVSGHANRVVREAAVRAKILAPKRTGHLAESVEPGYRPFGPYRYAITLQAHASYAPFVLMGTHTPITPFAGRWLKVPTTRMGGKFFYTQYVRGQRANNFLAAAMAGALGMHGIEILG